MNFKTALQAMAEGGKVRLSDWLGYWFIPNDLLEASEGAVSTDYIHVFTKNGDIIDSPNIERYKDRDDWVFVEETGWSFDMALRFLKNQKYVRRAAWPVKTIAFMEYGGLFIDSDPTGGAEIAEIWDPKREDVLANDWQFVPA